MYNVCYFFLYILSPPLAPRWWGHLYYIYNMRRKLNLCEFLKIFLIGCKIKQSSVILQIFLAKSYVFVSFCYKICCFYTD